MNQSQKFTEDDIPYNILNRFGFTREMIEDMPDAIITKLKNGHTTPVLPIQVTADNGDKILSAAKLSLYRNDNGEVRIMFLSQARKGRNLALFPAAAEGSQRRRTRRQRHDDAGR